MISTSIQFISFKLKYGYFELNELKINHNGQSNIFIFILLKKNKNKNNNK